LDLNDLDDIETSSEELSSIKSRLFKDFNEDKPSNKKKIDKRWTLPQAIFDEVNEVEVPSENE
jgi:hypothetical protein